MKKQTSTIMLGLALAMAAPLITTAPAFAQSSYTGEKAATADQNQSFFNSKYKINGEWSLVQRDGKSFISFSDDFKTKNGPDLKIFLSPTAAADVNGKNAVNGSLLLGKLQNNKGAQEYEIPAGTDLSKYKTVLVHCQAYSVLWGGGSI